jgi:hypothetical protein
MRNENKVGKSRFLSTKRMYSLPRLGLVCVAFANFNNLLSAKGTGKLCVLQRRAYFPTAELSAMECEAGCYLAVRLRAIDNRKTAFIL